MLAWLLATALAVPDVDAARPVPPDDAAMPSHMSAPLAGPDALMAVPDALRERFHDAVISRTSSPRQRLQMMMDFLFDEDGLGMRYAPEATHTVGEAFRTRRANCLSFTLLSVALAREAGLEAYGQNIDQALSWRQQDNNIVHSNHVNAGVRLHRHSYTIDVASDSVMARGDPRRIDDARLAALYHSNRAMELVLEGRNRDALPHALYSAELDQRSATVWNNLGVAHLRSGDPANAMAAYQRAIVLDQRHPGVLFNLAQAHERNGDRVQAEHLHARARRVLDGDPFHHFLQGHAAEQRGDADTAAQHYRRAIRLHGREHRFHHALARVSLQLGDRKTVTRALRRALELGGDAEFHRYRTKLDFLQAGLGG